MIYLDNAATTKVSRRVLDVMPPFFAENYGNPSSIHALGRAAAKSLRESRNKIAEILSVLPEEICFTSCATESNNQAILTAAAEMKKRGKTRVITSKTEHPSVLNTVRFLERNGFDAVYLNADRGGRVDIGELSAALNENTALVTIQSANSETGVLQPTEEISSLCREKDAVFHCDIVQSAPHMKFDLSLADTASVSGHKLHAPKGVGILYVKKGSELPPLLHGGDQERGMRPGTENPAFAAAVAEALEEACEAAPEAKEKYERLSARIISEVSKIPDTRLNGDVDHKLPSILNFSFGGLQGEALVLQLDLKGICCSAGSACSSGGPEPSHVLLAMGLSPEEAAGSLRISMSRFTSDEEIDIFLETLNITVEKMRKLSK